MKTECKDEVKDYDDESTSTKMLGAAREQCEPSGKHGANCALQPPEEILLMVVISKGNASICE